MISMRNLNLRTTLLAVTACAVIFSSCEKQDSNPGPSVNPTTSERTVVKDKRVKNKVVQMANEIPSIGVYNSTMDKVIVFDPNNAKDGFSFSSPNDGWNFSNSEEVQFVENPSGGGILFIGPGSLGSNSAGGGGTVVAGQSALDINYTFCFSASESALNLDFFDLGQEFDGISGVIGIAGDFEALMNSEIDEDAELTDYFQGIAAYYVYDNEASGSYDIIDWYQSMEEEPDFGNEALAYVFDFQDFNVYFSSDGTINVNGGSMTFNGEYFAVLNLFDDFFSEGEGEEPEEPEVVIVSGFGTMGCN